MTLLLYYYYNDIKEVKQMDSPNTDTPIDQLIYNKTYTCPLCQSSFTTKAIRSGKNQLVSIDEDLYAHYSHINPLLYSVIICPKCGYCTLNTTFTPLLPKQKEWLREYFIRGVYEHPYGPTCTTEEAIKKHQSALFAATVRKSKISEQAMISQIGRASCRERVYVLV